MSRAFQLVAVISALSQIGCKTNPFHDWRGEDLASAKRAGLLSTAEMDALPAAAAKPSTPKPNFPITRGMTRRMVEDILEEESPADIPVSGIWGNTSSRYSKVFDIRVSYDANDRVTGVFASSGEEIDPYK